MPHSRERHVLPLFLSRLKLSRVIAIQGCRQSGKSFFAKKILSQSLPDSKYLTFDNVSESQLATNAPDTYLAQYPQAKPLILDEAQKVSAIFNAVKFRVDEKTTPGQYVLLGSTEFNKLLKIRESLTGRMSRIRLFSMNLAEANEKELIRSAPLHLFKEKSRFSRETLLRHLERGGFPGTFFVRTQREFEDLLRDWIDLSVHRDIQQFPQIKVDSLLAFEVLQRLATVQEPTATEVAKAMRKDTRVVQRILNLLETLFVVHKIPPHSLGTGKSHYFLCDVSLVSYFHGSLERKLTTWLVHEQLSQRSYLDDRDHQLYYYRTTKGSIIDLVIVNTRTQKISAAIKTIATEKFDRREFEILKAFGKKVKDHQPKLIGFGSTHYKEKEFQMFPWESLG